MKLGSIFSNGVVLQRNQPIRVWGESKPNSFIKAEIAGVSGYAKTSGSGDFLLILPPLEHGGPFDLTVSLEEDTQESVTVSNVLIGEVWLCSGQSNMQYMLGSRWAASETPENVEPVGVQQEKEFIKSVCPADDIRFITIPMQVTGCSEKYFEASWMSMTSENAPQASAAAAWFAAEIKKELNVPIGLICCSWG